MFRKIVNYVLKNNARIFSSKSIHNYIKTKYYNCSINTIIKYINCLKEAFAIEEIAQYYSKAKKELAYYGKLYNTDVCFNSLRVEASRYDIEHNLENIVYNELLYMGYSVKTFTINGSEIDFLCEKDNKKIYVQVAYSVANENTYSREMKAFSILDNINQKILITNDSIDYSTSTVKHIKLPDFLLLEEL
ncbi:ATP-binding protein [Metamycoplasma subdolum]|nr:ATP-binding protein [Metamycoplasma subdolum]WPB50569.1 ATP-binding protein [Metamycoplasma subdolum]